MKINVVGNLGNKRNKKDLEYLEYIGNKSVRCYLYDCAKPISRDPRSGVVTCERRLSAAGAGGAK